MSATMPATDDSTDEYTPDYGDRFRHIITGEEQTVQDVRDGRVTWTKGGWDDVADLVAAVKGEGSLYEPVAVGDGVYEGSGYGDY